MTQPYLSKSVTIPSTGVVASAFVIGDWSVRNNPDPTKVVIQVGVYGYVTPEAFSEKLSPVPGVRYNYRFNSSNFPEDTDLTLVTLPFLYTALETYLAATPTDPLHGSTFASI